MKKKFKVGDRVLISKPDSKHTDPYWSNSMDKYHNTVQKIEGINNSFKYIEIDHWNFNHKWLTKIKKSITVNRIQLASLIGLDPCKEFNSVINSLLVTQSGKNIKLKKDVLTRYKECKTYQKYLLEKIGITEVLVTATLEYISEKDPVDFSILNNADIFYLNTSTYGWLFKGKDPFNTKVKGVDVEDKTKFKNIICSKKDVTILRKATPLEIELYNNIYCPYKKEELIFVRWRSTDSWDLRYFSHIEDNKVFCFNAQKKDGNTTCWDDHAPAIGVKLPK